MSTRKYVILILLGLVLLAGLSFTFVHFYNKKNQTTDALAAIPADAAAVVKLTQPLQFFSSNPSLNFFSGVATPQIRSFMEKLSLTNEFGKVMSNPILVSFHPDSSKAMSPLIVLRYNEIFSNHTLETILRSMHLKVGTIDYNGSTIYSCAFADGYTLYLSHSKGLTAITPTLKLLEASVRTLESAAPVSTELHNVLNLASSTSSASIAINTQKMESWISKNLFSAEAQWASSLQSLCSWIILDYQQGNDELLVSGVLTNGTTSAVGKSLSAVAPKEMLTPSLITENTAFALELLFDSYTQSLPHALLPDSVKIDIRNIVTAADPDRAVLQHIRIPGNDSSGFVAILFPHSSESALQKVKQVKSLGGAEVGSIARLSLDTSSIGLGNLLGAPFGSVKPQYMLIEKDRIVLSETANLLSQYQKEQAILAMRNSRTTKEVWRNKITLSGVAALYINPEYAQKLFSTILTPATRQSVLAKTVRGYKGIGMMLTPGGNNLIVSGYLSLKSARKSKEFTFKLPKQLSQITRMASPNGSSLVTLAFSDSIVALNANLNTVWKKKLPGKVDSTFALQLADRNVLGAIVKNTVYFFSETGTIVSLFTLESNVSRIIPNAIPVSTNKVAVADKSNNVYMVNPLGREKPVKLFRFNSAPSNISLIEIKEQPYFIIGRSGRTEIGNTKGSIIRRIPFSFEQGKALSMGSKVLLLTPTGRKALNTRLLPLPDKMAAGYANITGSREMITENGHSLVLFGDKLIDILGGDFTVRQQLSIVGQPASVQHVPGSKGGTMVIDTDQYVYLFNAKGRLAEGYPFYANDSKLVISSSDGTLFAVYTTANALVSKEINADFTTLL